MANTIPSSDKNPSGRVFNWPTIRKIRNRVIRAASLFGKEVSEINEFTSREFFNASASLKRLEHIILMKKKGSKSFRGEFNDIATRFGVVLIGSSLGAPGSLNLTTKTNTTLTPTWSQLSKNVPVTYEWAIYLTSNLNSAVQSGTVVDSGTVAITGLTANTNYTFKVRGTWSIGGLTYRSDWASGAVQTNP